MRASGDLTARQRKLSAELSKFELKVDKHKKMPPEQKAKAYVCMAHDWYEMDMEEKGNQVLVKAERVCPGYFAGPVAEQQRENADFDLLVKKVTIFLVALLAGNLRDRCD